MPIDPEKLLAALKAKFRKPRDVLTALGFDEAMASSLMPSNGVGNGSGELRDLVAGLRRLADEAKSLRDSDHRLLVELASIDGADKAKFLDHLEEHAPFDARTDRDDDRQGADRRGARGRDQEEEPADVETRLARMRKFLTSRGMSQSGVDEAIALARKALEGREGHLPDDMEGDEMLRKNAMAGGIGGMAGDSFREMFGDAAADLKVDLTASELASFNRLYPGAKKIGQGTSPARRPTARDAASFDRLFPEASRIRQGAGR